MAGADVSNSTTTCRAEDVPPQQRQSAASLLARLLGQPKHGPRVALSLARFLPDGIISAIRDGPADRALSELTQTSETPELVWSQKRAAAVGAKLADLAAELYREQADAPPGSLAEWDPLEKAKTAQEVCQVADDTYAVFRGTRFGVWGLGFWSSRVFGLQGSLVSGSSWC